MTLLRAAFLSIIAFCVGAGACSSSDDGMVEAAEPSEGIVITGVSDARCFESVEILADGLDPIDFPSPEAGETGNIPVQNGRVSVPLTLTGQAPIRVTDIMVVIPDECADVVGEFDYEGDPFEPLAGSLTEIPWSRFN